MEEIDIDLLEKITDIKQGKFEGAYNIRKNCKGIERKITDNINIVTKEDVSGINIYVKENTKFEFIHIPVIITESGLKDLVYNDFYIGKNANVIIIAGCGIHNDHHENSQHDGIHRFFLEEGAKVKYIEKHYGEGVGERKKNFKSSNRSLLERKSYVRNGILSNKRSRFYGEDNKGIFR